MTVRGICQEVGGCGSDEVQVGSSCEADVFALRMLDRLEEILVDGTVRESFEGRRADELLCRFRHGDGDGSSGLDELAGQVGRFVRGDSAGHADQDFAILEGVHNESRIPGAWIFRSRRSEAPAKVTAQQVTAQQERTV